MLNESENPNETESQTTPEAPLEPTSAEPQGGAEPSSEEASSTPAENRGSEPTIPYSRFQEVNRKMREYEARLNQQQPAAQPQQQLGNDAPKQDQFQTYEEFIEARAAYAGRQAAVQQFNDLQEKQRLSWQQQQEQTRESKAGANFAPQWQAELAKDPTLKTKPADHIGDLPKELALSIMGSKAAGPIMAELIKNPAEVYRLGAMSPLDAAMELGQMAGRLAGSTTPPKKVASTAPKPISPVGSGKDRDAGEYSDDMSMAAYMAKYKPIG